VPIDNDSFIDRSQEHKDFLMNRLDKEGVRYGGQHSQPKRTYIEEDIEAEGEMVDHPPHYGGKFDQYEVIKVMRAWDLRAAREFCRFNAIKYLARDGGKPGVSALQDNEKAAWYAAELVDIEKELRSETA
jgi:hypothetical protein